MATALPTPAACGADPSFVGRSAVVPFVDLALARRIEAAECDLCRDVARIARADGDARAGTWDVAGGAAVYAGDSSPCNKLVGLGLDRPPREDELAAAEAALDRRGVVVRAEVSTLAGATAAMLAARGYALQGFEYVLGRNLTEADGEAAPPSIAVEDCAAADHEPWVDAIVAGFAHADGGAPHEEFPRDVLRRTFDQLGRTPGFRRYLVRHTGAIVGAASLRVRDGIAQLCGTATLPAMRRRGIQSTLVRRRLADAVAAGCTFAVVTAAPGSQSQQNLMRAGFELLLARAILERPAAG